MADPTKDSGFGVMGTARLEAFSDGVFAIAVTLLILEVKVVDDDGSLAEQLRHAWPSYSAYVVSFIVIGTMWINHHRMFSALQAIDHTVIVANLALLLVISFIPFPTKLVGEHLTRGTDADARTAVLLYGATSIAVSVVFPVLWWSITRNLALTKPSITPEIRRDQMRRNLVGLPTYTVITLFALVSPVASLVGFGAVALFYLFPGRPSRS